jgi:hypothetical protein
MGIRCFVESNFSEHYITTWIIVCEVALLFVMDFSKMTRIYALIIAVAVEVTRYISYSSLGLHPRIVITSFEKRIWVLLIVIIYIVQHVLF